MFIAYDRVLFYRKEFAVFCLTLDLPPLGMHLDFPFFNPLSLSSSQSVFQLINFLSVIRRVVEDCVHSYAGMKHCLSRLLLKSSRTYKELPANKLTNKQPN